MAPAIFKFSDPKVAAVVRDNELLRRWEVLRTSPKPMCVAELAAACRLGLDAAQSTVDRLTDAGFAVKIRASSRTRRVTYRSVSEQLVVTWDRSLPEERAAILEAQQNLRTTVRVIFDRSVEARINTGSVGPHMEFDAMTPLTRAEAAEALTIITTAARALEALSARARQRAKSSDAATEPHPIRTFLCGMQLIPVPNQELPLAELTIWEERSAADQITMISGAPRAVLTERETEIARRLAAGESRPTIATAIGLSKHTVATVSKRIYTKLGIHSRAQLSERMRLG